MCGGVKVNQDQVVKTDIVASNGVIHVIDAVVLANWVLTWPAGGCGPGPACI
jgi:uncharacterized surface protein with fasciclin (FAS1) repeats